MTKALFAGSFNPPTLGHLDIMVRAALLFGELTVGIARDSQKERQQLFSPDEKILLIQKMTKEIPGINVVAIPGLVVDYASENGIKILIRGIRDTIDYALEARMASMNRQISDLETLFLVTAPEYSHLSSTLAREIASSGHSLHGIVPESILIDIEKKFTKGRH